MSPVVVVVFADQLDDDLVVRSGRPRQLKVIWENRRYSILFHLLVPGGRCATVTARPVSAANWARFDLLGADAVAS